MGTISRKLLVLFMLLVCVNSAYGRDWDDLLARHQQCLVSLQNYFTSEVSQEDMEKFLSAQYELTFYKVYGTFLEQKNRFVQQGERGKSNATFLQLLTDNVDDMKDRYASHPDFQKALKSFEKSPLTINTFIQLVPFWQQYLQTDKGFYTEGPTKLFGLNYRDMKMLEIMDKMESRISESEKPAKRVIDGAVEPFLIKMNKLDARFLYGKNIPKTLEDVENRIVKPRIEVVADFMKSLELPVSCSNERADLAEIQNCSGCYHRNEDTVESLIGMSREVADTLYDSLLEREDLRKVCELNLRTGIFYYGINSIWGRYD